MRVYILISQDRGYNEDVVSVFTSYSAMVTWLKEKYDYESELYSSATENYGRFKNEICLFEGVDYEYSIYFEAHDVIGEHCPRTDKLKFT